MEQKYFSTSETAALLKVTPKTLRTWDKEGIFKPEVVNEGTRRYSQTQIELKTGQTIYQLKNPITLLGDSNKIEDLMCIAEENKTVIDFNTLLGRTIVEKYESIYCSLIQVSTAMYRKNKHSPPNFIFTSPEIAALFECACGGFAPSAWLEEEVYTKRKVVYIGTVNNRWRIYHSYLMPMQELLMGYVEDGRIFEKENFIANVHIGNFIL